jgi:hypothetical protein
MNREEFRNVQNTLIIINARAFWMSSDYIIAIQNFNQAIGAIVQDCTDNDVDVNEGQGEVGKLIILQINEAKLREAGIKLHSEFKELLRNIMNAQSIMLGSLYDIESFLAERLKSKFD